MNNKITKAEKSVAPVDSKDIKKGDAFWDVDKHGNVIPWVDRKHQSIQYANALANINEYAATKGIEFKVSEDQVQRVFLCGEYREYKSYVNAETDDVMKHSLHRAFFCKRRMCPQCMWLRTMTESHINKLVLEEIHKEYKSAYGYFLTLTVKNVKADQLKDTIKHIMKSFTKMMRKSRIKKYLLGYSRTVEVTYNAKTDTYHPHIHAILIFKSSLRNSEKGIFKQSKKNGQNEFIDMWQEAAELDYRPSITIEQYTKAKTYVGKYGRKKGKTIHKTREQNISSSAAELSKYPTEIIDVAEAIPIYDDSESDQSHNGERNLIGYDYVYNLDQLLTIEEAFFNKRLMTYGGIFKKKRNEIKKQIIEQAKLNEEEEEKVFSYTDGEGNSVTYRLTKEDILYNYFRAIYNYAEEYRNKAFIVSEMEKGLTGSEFQSRYGYSSDDEEDQENQEYIEIVKSTM